MGTLRSVGDESDRTVWQQLLSGDERAFGLIWDRHHDRVFRHLIANGNAPADAEDLTAAVFFELWRRRESVRFVDDSALPWLIVTAQNVTRNAARSRRRYRRLLDSLPMPDDIADHAELVADQNDERTVRLRAEITRARPIDATLLAMTAIEGFTVSEAASALGLSEPAARMRLSRFRAHLRTAVTIDPVHEGGA